MNTSLEGGEKNTYPDTQLVRSTRLDSQVHSERADANWPDSRRRSRGTFDQETSSVLCLALPGVREEQACDRGSIDLATRRFTNERPVDWLSQHPSGRPEWSFPAAAVRRVPVYGCWDESGGLDLLPSPAGDGIPGCPPPRIL